MFLLSIMAMMYYFKNGSKCRLGCRTAAEYRDSYHNGRGHVSIAGGKGGEGGSETPTTSRQADRRMPAQSGANEMTSLFRGAMAKLKLTYLSYGRYLKPSAKFYLVSSTCRDCMIHPHLLPYIVFDVGIGIVYLL